MQKRRHIGSVPDDVGSIQWDDSPSAKREDAAYRKECEALEKRWQAVRAVEVEITAAWRRDAERQLAEVAPSIARDQHELLLAKLDEQMKARQAAENKVTQDYLDQLLAARDRLWRQQAERRLAAATKAITTDHNRNVARKDRSIRERLRARRGL